ncbi:hypothetical protein AB0K71_05825 [Streptomyces syringium]|uniref:hypothetical protein n=1 Tax=Streptomyces syringium TaxID=76729 RepID=UPI00341AB2A2
MNPEITLAASTGANFIGGLGAGGTALVLTTILVQGTKKDGIRHGLNQNQAVTVGLADGTVLAGAGQVWGVPDDIVLGVLDAVGVGTSGGPLGTITMPAVALTLVAFVYIKKLKPRTAGVNGLIMASVFANAGGGWAMISRAIGDVFVRIAS